MAKTCTLIEFWNDNDVAEISVVGNGCPGGQSYKQDLESDGEDYCDLSELLDSGLFPFPEDGSRPQHDLTGTVSDDGTTWEWDGNGRISDVRGNDYTRISLTARVSVTQTKYQENDMATTTPVSHYERNGIHYKYPTVQRLLSDLPLELAGAEIADEFRLIEERGTLSLMPLTHGIGLREVIESPNVTSARELAKAIENMARRRGNSAEYMCWAIVPADGWTQGCQLANDATLHDRVVSELERLA